MNQYKILIVGAGITGTSLNHALSKQGHLTTIIEKAEQYSVEGAGICLPGNAMIELEKLGFDQKIMEIGHQVFDIEYALKDGKTLSKASLMEKTLNQAPFVSLSRNKLLEIIREESNSQVKFNTTISTMKNSNKGVSVLFSHGDTEYFDLVIGADGINSQIRSLEFTNTTILKPDITNWRFTANMNTTDKHPIYYIGNDNAFMIYPMGDNTVYCYGQITDKNGYWYKKNPLNALPEIFKDYCEPISKVLSQLSNSSEIITGELKSVSTIEAVNQRVLILGDALHGCPPTLQQGVGMGLEDVNCLISLLKENSLGDTLSKFEKIRKPRIEWVLKESNKIIELASMGNYYLGRLLRNFIIRKKGPANVSGWRKLMSEKAY